MATQDDYIKTALRLPRQLHADLMASAQANARSLNAEIVARLQSSFEPKQDDRLVQALENQLSAYKALLRRAAGAIQMALIRGKERRIPDEDVRWLGDEYRELNKLAADEKGGNS